MRLPASLLFVVLSACAPSLHPVSVVRHETDTDRNQDDRILADGFEALGERDGVTLYRRPARAGIELAAEGDLPASPERILRVLLDYLAHKTWEKRLAECKVLTKDSQSLDVYERLGLPVIDDRDYTLHVTWGDEGGVLWTKFAVANDRGPREVRLSVHEGGWLLSPMNDGAATHALYRFHLDLESDIAAMAGTGQAESDLIEMFAEIRGQLPKYP